MPTGTRLDRFDRLLLRGLVGVAFSALIVATAGSEAVRPLGADAIPGARGTSSAATPTALCARADPPVNTFNRSG